MRLPKTIKPGTGEALRRPPDSREQTGAFWVQNRLPVKPNAGRPRKRAAGGCWSWVKKDRPWSLSAS
jgi:hypothetical protein